MTPEYVLSHVVSFEPEGELIETSYLVQHLRSGYYRKFWLQFERFKELIRKNELIGSGYWEGFEKIPAEEREELNELKLHLLTTLYRIMLEVIHGSPLSGWCDLCSGRKVSVSGN